MTKAALTVGQVTEVRRSALMPDPDQPRKSFDEKGLAQLAESIGKRGILVPLLVRPGKRGKYLIHDGERRWRAAKIAKVDALPVLLIGNNDTEENTRTGQLAVNNLREQLRPMEVARLLADLRQKHFASINELAAHLDREGLPAMSPKQISEAIRLCDLPEKVQAMIDAGEIEASAAAKLYSVLQYPKVVSAATKEVARQATWSGRATGRDVEFAIKRALRDNAADLGRTESWYGDEAVYFNPKVVCKGCEHLVIVGGEKFCMSPKDFKQKNDEAKAAGLLPGGKKPPKDAAPAKPGPTDDEAKAEARGRTLREKCRDYLHDYLVRRIIDKMVDDIDITDELLAWHAMQRPGADPGARRPIISNDYQARKVAGIGGLEELLTAKDSATARLSAALEVAHGLPWRETQVICHELWSTQIEKVWQMDEAFVNLFRKVELLKLVEDHGLQLEEGREWKKLKVSELKSEILARDSQVASPMCLQEIYRDVEWPFVPWGERGWNEEDDGDQEGEVSEGGE